ncbi:single-strand DNA-binding protein [Chitinophaga skermanii]|uniref:Single-stranded DNA-binding protein n=1 Tax=Chitinophaga skermanii TaxID=331697 RepID=A0A327Q6F5_9BACT|nr:single-stranded DNA-binding protein [Chitinophaga skermanii]RAI99351.1 single-strand DNA-binding protein [Chitinophaga skermanii]
MIKMQLIGFVGNNALSNTWNKRNVLNFQVAHGQKFKDQQGEVRSRTTWVDCALWDREIMEKHLLKGTHVFVEGTPYTESYKTLNGEYQAALKLIVHRVELLPFKKEGTEILVQPNMVTTAEPTDELPF